MRYALSDRLLRRRHNASYVTDVRNIRSAWNTRSVVSTPRPHDARDAIDASYDRPRASASGCYQSRNQAVGVAREHGHGLGCSTLLHALLTKASRSVCVYCLIMAARPGVGPAFVTMDEYDCMIWPGFLRRTVRAHCALSSRAQPVVPGLSLCCVSHGTRVCAPSKLLALRTGVGVAGARCWRARCISGPKSSCSACLLSAL